MPDIPKPSGDVLRRNPENECGTPVGQINVQMREFGLQTISFYCNQPRFHTDGCKFIGSEVTVLRTQPGLNVLVNIPQRP